VIINPYLIYLSFGAIILMPYKGLYNEKNKILIKRICLINLVFSLSVLIVSDTVFYIFNDSASVYFYYIVGTSILLYNIFYTKDKIRCDSDNKTCEKDKEYISICCITVLICILLLVVLNQGLSYLKWIVDIIFIIQILINYIFRIYLPLYMKYD